MKQFLSGLVAVSLLSVAPVAISTSAQAAVVAGSDVCGELPNVKWSWSIQTTEPTVEYGAVTYGTVAYSGASGNGSASASQEITTTPGSTICTALNPQGKINEEHSTVMGGGDPVTTTEDLGTVQVCFQSPSTPDLIEGCR